MPIFIMLTRLHPDAARSPAALEQLERHAMDRVRQKCPQVEWISSYAVLGPCDYLDVFRAPDIETVRRSAPSGTPRRKSGRRRSGIASRNWCARCPAPAERSAMGPSTRDHSPRSQRTGPAILREAVIPPVGLAGALHVPSDARALVIFAWERLQPLQLAQSGRRRRPQ